MSQLSWDEDRLPTRTEAIGMAVRALSAADEWLPPDAMGGRAWLAEVWLAVADRVSDEPTGGPGVDGLAAVDDPAGPALGVCGHQQTVAQFGIGRPWTHLSSMTICDDPPGTARPIPRE